MEQAMVIRLARPEDAATLAEIYAPYVRETTVTFEYEAPDAAEFMRRMAEIQSVYPYLVAEAGGEIVGYAYAHRYAARAAYDWSAETSVYVRMGHSGQGAGRRLYGALLGLLRAQRVQNAFAIIALPNEPSVAFHRAQGFMEVAKNQSVGYKQERWLDTVTYELFLGAHEIPPRPVIPFSELSAETIAPFLQ